ncbi:MAG TPA: ATP-binding protein, partial [Gammaproteobacteria bacterium]|nr:ATP-binding protein [Gammaproteobacteria bacterium]
FAGIAERREPFSGLENVNLHKDGHPVVLETNGVPFFDETGQLLGYRGIDRDVTERKRYEDSLREARDELECRVRERTAELQDANAALREEVRERSQAEETLRLALAELETQKFALDQHAIVAITDRRGRITYANRRFCEISQYAWEELAGNTHRIVNSGWHPREFFKDLWRTIGSGEVWHGEICNRRKDGSLYWVDTTVVPFLEDDGRPYQYVSIRTDVTVRKQAEQEHTARQQRLDRQQAALMELARSSMFASETLDAALAGLAQTVAETVGVARAGIWLCGGDRDRVLCRALYDGGGGCPDPVSGLDWSANADLFEVLDRERLVAMDEMGSDSPIAGSVCGLPGGPRIGSMMVASVRRAGAVAGFVCLDHGRNVRHWHADEQHFLGAVADLVALMLEQASRQKAEAKLAAFSRELQAINQELDAALVSAQAAAQAKSQFLATMSHEVRTPINGILGMLQLIGGTELTGEQREYVDVARDSTDKLLTQLNDILDFSRVEAGRVQLEKVPFDAAAVIGEVAGLLRVSAHQKGLELVDHMAADFPETVYGDPLRFRQIVTNLVSNAVKFTSRGRVEIRGGVTDRRPGQVMARFEVVDTGIGIAPEDHERIFEAFTQGDGSTTRRYGGTGLGLSICRQLIVRMGGDISVKSSPGRGSTFTFTVRFAAACDAGALAGTES